MSYTCKCGKEFPNQDARAVHGKSCGQIRNVNLRASANLTRHLLRRRLIQLNKYTEKNVEAIFAVITKNGTDFSQIVVSSNPQVLNVLDKTMLEIISNEEKK